MKNPASYISCDTKIIEYTDQQYKLNTFILSSHIMNTIKIADLLHHIGTTDTITLENISITDLPLTPNGLIQGGLHLQSASDYRIDASMYDIQCILDTTCESCG
jgi:hypothetical protein